MSTRQAEAKEQEQAASAAPAGALMPILGMMVTLAAFLLVIRAQVMGYGWYWLKSPGKSTLVVLAGACRDWEYLAGLGLVFWLTSLFFRRPLARRMLLGCYVLISLLSLLLGLANIKIVQMLGGPLDYQWLYYSGFLRSFDALQAIGPALSLSVVAGGAAGLAGAIAVWLLVSRGLRRLSRGQKSRRGMLAGLIVFGAVYFPVSEWYLRHSGWGVNTTGNPVVVLVGSIIWQSTPGLYTDPTSVGPEDFQVAAERSSSPAAATRPASGIRNVLIVVLESTPAEYLQPYGGLYPITPALVKYRQQARVYRSIYAHLPGTNPTMVSLLTSSYPWLNYRLLTQEHPDADLTSISQLLKERGYRTGFFYSADLRFGGAEQFLQHHHFDALRDYRGINGSRRQFQPQENGWDFMDGCDDATMADALMQWAAERPDQPFIAMMWTMQTHYPYFTVDPLIDYGVGDGMFQRYLNALREGDAALGRIMRSLEEKGLDKSTLVVVVGDHGEAFGRHEQYAHAKRVYEENVHVPLVLINSQLFKGEDDSTVGGMVDIAPTILDLLGLPLPEAWQGRSLLASDRSPRTFFFAWAGWAFGYREGERKYIYNAADGSYEVYDLAHDPQETKNLAGELSAEQKNLIYQRLAAWVQYQDRLIDRVTSHRISR